MGRLGPRVLARLDSRRGVAKSGHRAAFGEPRSPVRIRAPRPLQFEKWVWNLLPRWFAIPLAAGAFVLAGCTLGTPKPKEIPPPYTPTDSREAARVERE